jgi:hypothetical protein
MVFGTHSQKITSLGLLASAALLFRLGLFIALESSSVWKNKVQADSLNFQALSKEGRLTRK